jgi:RimJ/RimL family protein N-acetyltransferase
MPAFTLRTATEADRSEVAELVCISMNTWDVMYGMGPGRFSGGPAQTDIFWQQYETLDPGHCLVAEHNENGRLGGSCYYRERETHVSLGIMNVHPNYFGHGIAKQLLRFVTDFTDDRDKPLRLVSSVMNLESFSLYTKAGLVTRHTYQDVVNTVTPTGVSGEQGAGIEARDATLEDIEAIATLELEISGISRAKDYRHFVEDELWGMSVIDSSIGGLDGYLASIGHPLLTLTGPGVARTEEQAAALLLKELNRYPDTAVLALIPVDKGELVQLCYALGARNCEMHAAQIRGAAQPFAGVSLPTFLPETG